jgi:hypothetical protein
VACLGKLGTAFITTRNSAGTFGAAGAAQAFGACAALSDRVLTGVIEALHHIPSYSHHSAR